ncbi:hypothetical protein Fmac_011253 [Flemingia macrophylla]|uniref:FBD domain-containing protein n=1 Tax=Flemingia macrophylla TaxID=520843 RepID=A0ABD1MLX3_9FABA
MQCLKDAFVSDIPVFDNLIQLEFSYSSYSWNLLSRILQGSHKLEVLMVYKETQKYTKGPESRWNHLPLIPECILLHLKTFCFREYQGMEDELDFVGYIMQNARALETIIIYISTSLRLEVQLQLRRNLSALQRNYGTREIEFH